MELKYKEFDITDVHLSEPVQETKDGIQSNINPFGGFSGYAATFGNMDRQRDVIQKGAFVDTTADFLKQGFITLSHDIKSLPIATISNAYEDEKGWHISADFHSTKEAQDVRTIMRERIERGKSVKLSIGYLPVDVEPISDGTKIIGQSLRKLNVHEVAYVNIPANNMADVTGAKSLDNLVFDLSSPENEESFEASVLAGKRFSEHSDAVLATVKQYVDRANSIKVLRVKEGRTLSTSNTQRLQVLLDTLQESSDKIETVIADIADLIGVNRPVDSEDNLVSVSDPASGENYRTEADVKSEEVTNEVKAEEVKVENDTTEIAKKLYIQYLAEQAKLLGVEM